MKQELYEQTDDGRELRRLRSLGSKMDLDTAMGALVAMCRSNRATKLEQHVLGWVKQRLHASMRALREQDTKLLELDKKVSKLTLQNAELRTRLLDLDPKQKARLDKLQMELYAD